MVVSTTHGASFLKNGRTCDRCRAFLTIAKTVIKIRHKRMRLSFIVLLY
jgi:hypothetical protein